MTRSAAAVDIKLTFSSNKLLIDKEEVLERSADIRAGGKTGSASLQQNQTKHF